MVWPANTNLQEVLDHPADYCHPELVGQLTMRGFLPDSEVLPADKAEVVSFNCSMAPGVVAAELTSEDDRPFTTFRLDFISETPDRDTALTTITRAVLQGFLAINVEVDDLILGYGNVTQVDQLAYDQTKEPELELDITSWRYEHPDDIAIFEAIKDEVASQAKVWHPGATD